MLLEDRPQSPAPRGKNARQFAELRYSNCLSKCRSTFDCRGTEQHGSSGGVMFPEMIRNFLVDLPTAHG